MVIRKGEFDPLKKMDEWRERDTVRDEGPEVTLTWDSNAPIVLVQ